MPHCVGVSSTQTGHLRLNLKTPCVKDPVSILETKVFDK